MVRRAYSPTATGQEPVNVAKTTTVDRSVPKRQGDRYVRVAQPLKWWGGKYYTAPAIISLMPPHVHYVEPYFGGGAVLFAKDPLDPRHQWGEKGHEQGTSEVVNDLNLELTNFWKVLRNPATFAEFQRQLEATPFSQIEWEEAESRQVPEEVPDVDAAHALFVRCRQSRSGEFKDFTPLTRTRTRGKMSGETSAWLNCIEGLPAVHARLRRVVILHDSALNVIRKQDGPATLFYLDPPYLPSTRASKDNYKHDMTEDDHRELLKTIKQCRGKVMISGYPSGLYDTELRDWERHEIKIPNAAAGGKKKREMTEVVWMNF